MIPGSKGLNPHELAHRWVKNIGTRHDMRIFGRIVGVRSTEQFVGIKVGGLLTPTSIYTNIYYRFQIIQTDSEYFRLIWVDSE